MMLTFATFLGIDANLILLATTLLATIVTTISVIAISFMALAPHLSSKWALQFGVQDDDARTG